MRRRIKYKKPKVKALPLALNMFFQRYDGIENFLLSGYSCGGADPSCDPG